MKLRLVPSFSSHLIVTADVIHLCTQHRTVTLWPVRKKKEEERLTAKDSEGLNQTDSASAEMLYWEIFNWR